MACSPKSRVLCFGRDLDLLRTRLQVLAKNYDAVEVSSLDQLNSVCAEPPLQLALLCHTLSLEECSTATEIVQQRWPQAKVMALTTGFAGLPFERADAVVMSTQGPAVLLRAIEQLIQTIRPQFAPLLSPAR